MNEDIFQSDSGEWIASLPTYQRDIINQLLEGGRSFDEVAEYWTNVSLEDTYFFSASNPVGNNNNFLCNIKREIKAYLCGDKKYKKEREQLFGSKGLAKTYIVSSIAVSISPHLGVASSVISPIIALLLAGMGKITLNAWCALEDNQE